MDLREEKEEDVILTETVKLLNVSVGASKRASQLIAKFFMKHWTTREVYLTGNCQLKGYTIKHCHKDFKPSDHNSTISQPLDEVLNIRHLESLKKKHVLEIVFPYHSILLSFKSPTVMERWQSELINVTSGFVLFLMKSSNRSIKLGYYLLQFYMNKMIFYNLTNKEMVWMWNIPHIHSYQHRKTSSQLEIVAGRFPDNESGYFTFTGMRLGLLCQQMYTLALNFLPLTDDKLPHIDYSRLSTKQLHQFVPYPKHVTHPVTKPVSYVPVYGKRSKKKSLLRGAYSLNCLDEASDDKCRVHKMDHSHDDLRVFDENSIVPFTND